MFRGLCTLSLDTKGRLAVPSRYRERLAPSASDGRLIVTINTLDRCLFLYPLAEWEVVEAKLQTLSDFNHLERRTKQMMIGHAAECDMDRTGRILLPTLLREYAGMEKHIVMLGQRNKFELWDESTWTQQRDEWLALVGQSSDEPSDALRTLSF